MSDIEIDWKMLGVMVVTIGFMVAAVMALRWHGNKDCQRFEMREVEMIHESYKEGASIRKHQYKVCLE